MTSPNLICRLPRFGIAVCLCILALTVERSSMSVAMAPGAASTLCNEAQAPTGEMAVTPPSIRKSAPTTYAESSDAR